jgi:hypothetical protein
MSGVLKSNRTRSIISSFSIFNPSLPLEASKDCVTINSGDLTISFIAVRIGIESSMIKKLYAMTFNFQPVKTWVIKELSVND